MYFLSALLLLPLVGAVLVTVTPGEYTRLIRQIALTASAAALILAWGLLLKFDSATSGLQFVEQYRWNPRLGTSFVVGVDGFSFPMVLLATLLSYVALLASRNIKRRVKGYYLLTLVLESAMLGVFIAQDWALFMYFGN